MNNVKFSWNMINNAHYYDIRILKNNEIIETLWAKKGNSAEIKLESGDYTANIAAVNSSFNVYTFSDYISFHVEQSTQISAFLYSDDVRYCVSSDIKYLTTPATYATASYTAEGRLLDIRTTELTSGAQSAQASLPKADGAKYIKVFLWDSVEAMNPLAECETINL